MRKLRSGEGLRPQQPAKVIQNLFSLIFGELDWEDLQIQHIQEFLDL